MKPERERERVSGNNGGIFHRGREAAKKRSPKEANHTNSRVARERGTYIYIYTQDKKREKTDKRNARAPLPSCILLYTASDDDAMLVEWKLKDRSLIKERAVVVRPVATLAPSNIYVRAQLRPLSISVSLSASACCTLLGR